MRCLSTIFWLVSNLEEDQMELVKNKAARALEAEDYKGLFADYLNRFKDKLPEVRVKALRGGHRILADANALDYGAAAKAIFGAMRERLSDYDDAVRAEAVTALGALFVDRPSAMAGEVVGDLCNRLRDKKLPVRVAVVTQLVAAFRTYIARLHDEDASSRTRTRRPGGTSRCTTRSRRPSRSTSATCTAPRRSRTTWCSTASRSAAAPSANAVVV